jgi:hypothetical protein
MNQLFRKMLESDLPKKKGLDIFHRNKSCDMPEVDLTTQSRVTSKGYFENSVEFIVGPRAGRRKAGNGFELKRGGRQIHEFSDGSGRYSQK